MMVTSDSVDYSITNAFFGHSLSTAVLPKLDHFVPGLPAAGLEESGGLTVANTYG